MKGSTKKTEEPKAIYDVKVTRAKEFDGGAVTFDMIVNGVQLYGCWYREGQDKNGKDYEMISFPSQKGKDGKYYNHCWFKVDDDTKADIIDQLQKLV